MLLLHYAGHHACSLVSVKDAPSPLGLGIKDSSYMGVVIVGSLSPTGASLIWLSLSRPPHR